MHDLIDKHFWRYPALLLSVLGTMTTASPIHTQIRALNASTSLCSGNWWSNNSSCNCNRFHACSNIVHLSIWLLFNELFEKQEITWHDLSNIDRTIGTEQRAHISSCKYQTNLLKRSEQKPTFTVVSHSATTDNLLWQHRFWRSKPQL